MSYPNPVSPLPQQPFSRPSGLKFIWQRWQVGIILLTIILCGGLIRLVSLEEKSLWQDEIFTIASATGNNIFEATIRPDDAAKAVSPDSSDESVEGDFTDPTTPQPSAYYREMVTDMQSWDSFWNALSRNIQTPLYPLTMRWLITNFGPDPGILRLFSVLVGTLAIPCAFLLGKELKGDRFGLLLSSLVAFSGFQVTYSQTARVYALITVFVLLSTWLMLRLLSEKGEKKFTWLAFTLITVLGLYTQYLYNFVLLFQALYVLLFGKQNRTFLLKMAMTALVVGLAYLPWLPMLSAQQEFLSLVGHGNLRGLWNPISLIERLWNILTDLITPKFLVSKLLATGILIIGLFHLWKQKQEQKHLRWVFVLAGLWLFCIVGGLMGIDLVSQTHRILSKRYTILASPALYLMLGAALFAMPRRLGTALGSLMLALMLWNSVEVVWGPKFIAKENYQKAAQYITQHQRPASLPLSTVSDGKDLVLVSHSGVHAAGMSFYLPKDTPVLGISRKNPENPWDPAALANRLQNGTAQYERVWVVYTHAPKPLRQSISAWFEQGFSLAEHQKYSSVEVFLFQRNSAFPK